MIERYYSLNSHLRKRFGVRVQKITVDAGFTCPNRDGKISYGGCIYCNETGSGSGAFSKGISITRQIESAKPGLIIRYKAEKFLIYFQAFSNTSAPVERLAEVYGEALAPDNVVGLSIGTRPDCIDEEKIALISRLAENRLIWMEYGLQSAHNRTLDLINRGHDFACFQNAVRMTQNNGIMICAHVILGLPGETRDDMMETAEKLADLNIDGVKLHLLYAIKGTPLAKMYGEGKFKCLEMQEYADLVCDFLERIPKNAVVHRLTSDPHATELVAPMWAMEKSGTRNCIINTMEKRNFWQGSLV